MSEGRRGALLKQKPSVTRDRPHRPEGLGEGADFPEPQEALGQVSTGDVSGSDLQFEDLPGWQRERCVERIGQWNQLARARLDREKERRWEGRLGLCPAGDLT